MNDDFTPKDRFEYIRAAMDLRYSKDIIDRLKNATTNIQASNIMHDGRNEEWRRKKYGR